MGLFSRIVDRVKQFFWDIYTDLVEPALDWIRQKIEDIVVALRIFRHNLKALLAKWLQNDLFFVIFMQTVGAAVLYAPQLLAAAAKWTIVLWVKTMAEALKERVLDLININGLIDLVTVHKILMVIWQEYRKVLYSFADVVSQFSTDLGEGSAYLHAYFTALRGIMHGTNAILGGDPIQVEVEWYGRCAEFFERANDRFARYARDPGRLLYDFIDWYILEAASEQRDVSQAQLDEIRENRDRLKELDEGEKELRQSLDTFIELQPNAIEEQIRVRWDPINEFLIEFEEVFIAELMRQVNGIVDALEWREEQQKKVNAVVQAKANEQNRAIFEAWLLTEDQAAQAGASFDYALAASLKDDVESFNEAWDEYANRYAYITAAYVDALGKLPALRMEEAGAIHPKPERVVNIPSPFIGDY